MRTLEQHDKYYFAFLSRSLTNEVILQALTAAVIKDFCPQILFIKLIFLLFQLFDSVGEGVPLVKQDAQSCRVINIICDMLDWGQQRSPGSLPDQTQEVPQLQSHGHQQQLLPGSQEERTVLRVLQDKVQSVSQALPEHHRPQPGLHLRRGNHPCARLQRSLDQQTSYQL